MKISSWGFGTAYRKGGKSKKKSKNFFFEKYCKCHDRWGKLKKTGFGTKKFFWGSEEEEPRSETGLEQLFNWLYLSLLFRYSPFGPLVRKIFFLSDQSGSEMKDPHGAFVQPIEKGENRKKSKKIFFEKCSK